MKINKKLRVYSITCDINATEAVVSANLEGISNPSGTLEELIFTIPEKEFFNFSIGMELDIEINVPDFVYLNN